MPKCGIERFSSYVENYVRYRPSYPKRLIDFLYTECGFSRESVIADIGSGTGIFSRLLLERGSRVVGIEPDDAMRDASERLLCDEFQRFVAINGTAENTTLPESSVNHIVCAHSFHCFDRELCKKEFMRVLRPNGTVCIVWNKLLAEGDEFSGQYESLVKRFSSKSSPCRCRDISEQDYEQFFGSGRFSVLSLPNQQTLDFEGIKGRLLSNAFVPTPSEQGYFDMMAELKALFERCSQYGKVTLRYETEAIAGCFH